MQQNNPTLSRAAAAPDATTWWEGGTLRVGPLGLTLAGQSVANLVGDRDMPVYLYDGARVRHQLAELRGALQRFGRHRIFYALKANRFRPLLDLLRTERDIGIDACSPAEVDLSREAGFLPAEISVTATNLSGTDLTALARHGVHVNFDQVGAIARYARLVPRGTAIGLRIDPAVSAGYGVNARTDYGGGKLGILPADLDAALATAQHAGLRVDTLHMHLGWGLRETDEPAFRRALAIVAEVARRVASLECINVGGGLGGQLRASDRPLAPGPWAAAIAEAFPAATRAGGLTISCEPGTFVMAMAGILVTRVTAVWEKRGERWLGLAAGQAVNVYAAHYGLELEIVPVSRPTATPTTSYHVAGHINEAGDIFARQRLLPELAEGELVALLPAGAYGSSMASNHCLRGEFEERLLGEARVSGS